MREAAKLALVVILCAAPLSYGAVATVTGVRVLPAPSATQVYIELRGAVDLPHLIRLAGPDRVYIDLENVHTNLAGRLTGDNTRVRYVTVAEHNDYTRVTLELVAPLRYDISKSAGGLVITVHEPGSKSIQPAPDHPQPVRLVPAAVLKNLPAPAPPRPVAAPPAILPKPRTPTPVLKDRPAPATSPATLPSSQPVAALPSPQPVAESPATPSKPRTHTLIDITGIQLTASLGNVESVPEVLLKYSGYLAFVSGLNPDQVSRLFHPKDWTEAPLRPGNILLDNYFALRLASAVAPSWVVKVRSEQKIPDDWTAYLVLPSSFDELLRQTIRERALEQLEDGQVVSAEFTLATGTPPDYSVEAVKLRHREHPQ